MKNKKRLVASIALLALVAALALALSGCNALSDAGKLQTYDFDTDQVPTINSIVGERTVTAVDVTTTNGSPQKQYTYSSTSVFDDLVNYTTALRNAGWTVTQDYDFNTMPGSAQLAKQSADSGKVLVLSIAYQDGQYAIKITKTDGTLTMNDQTSTS